MKIKLTLEKKIDLYDFVTSKYEICTYFLHFKNLKLEYFLVKKNSKYDR